MCCRYGHERYGRCMSRFEVRKSGVNQMATGGWLRASSECLDARSVSRFYFNFNRYAQLVIKCASTMGFVMCVDNIMCADLSVDSATFCPDGTGLNLVPAILTGAAQIGRNVIQNTRACAFYSSLSRFAARVPPHHYLSIQNGVIPPQGYLNIGFLGLSCNSSRIFKRKLEGWWTSIIIAI